MTAVAPTAGPTVDGAKEDLCRRCGASCHVAVPVDEMGAVVVAGLHCQFLQRDGDRFACSVYTERFERAPWCHTAEQAQPLGYLASDCPYGAHQEGKKTLPAAEFARVFPSILRNLRAWGLPTYIDRGAFLSELYTRTGRRWALDPWPGDAERLRLRPIGFSQPRVASLQARDRPDQ
ncbi:MAG: hypothetical protein EXR77_19865 [Myxococcales bacterium]|nr:hypothetical protein [Myxococcales bacterium]